MDLIAYRQLLYLGAGFSKHDDSIVVVTFQSVDKALHSHLFVLVKLFVFVIYFLKMKVRNSAWF